MKFYSEKTKKIYDTEEELNKAELAVDKKKVARETRAKEVEKAIKEAEAASEKAHKLLADFCKDYGAYHTSISNVKDFDPFDWFFHGLF